MQITVENREQIAEYFSVIRQNAETHQVYAVKYLDFGIKIIRVICRTPEIILFLEQQLAFVLRDNADHFDETIVFWQVKDVKNFAYSLDPRINPKTNLRMRIDILANNRRFPDIMIINPLYSATEPFIRLWISSGAVEAYDFENHTCYYGVADLAPEELIKHGHLFVLQLNVLLKTPTTNLTHGAVFGYQGKGVLLCARGQRGKSTLTVHSMMHGCEYVSDDYQLLEKQSGKLFAYPIYSIITLSPQMFSKMYHDFRGKFCSNNARKDKYVFNISEYHNQFKTRYPIEICLFPEIVPDNNPDIISCSAVDKGRAIVQFIHSTVMQMRDLNDHVTIEKLYKMIEPLPFYKFNLSPNIAKNTEFLQQFLSRELSTTSAQNNMPRFLLDITFDLANILDRQTYTFYSMNKFATNLYEMLLSGISPAQISEELNKLAIYNPDLINEFNIFNEILAQKNLLSEASAVSQQICGFKVDLAKGCNYKLSLLEYDSVSTNELIQTRNRRIK